MWIRFAAYGVFGWCAEIVWTALYDLVADVRAGRAPDARLVGKTYLWMFPIYGGGGLLFERAHAAVGGLAWPVRGLLYTIGCFAVEWIAGWVLRRATGKIPWDYTGKRWHVRGLIRLDYAPVWFVFGMMLEQVAEVLRKQV